MKNTIILSLTIIIAGTIPIGCNGQKGYTIEGNISGADGKTMYLYKGTGPFFTAEDVADSTVIANGVFRFDGELASPRLYTVKIFPDDSRALSNERGYAFRPFIPVFVDYGKTSITAEYDDIPTNDLGGNMYDYSKVVVAGSPLHVRYVEYMEQKTAFDGERRGAFREYSAYLQARPRGPVSQGIAAVDKIDIEAGKLKSFAMRYIKENAGNNLGLFALLDNIDRFTASELDELTAALAEEVKANAFGQEVIAEAMRIRGSAVGVPYTDYELSDLDGNIVRLSDHVGKGRYVLLEFWASWCGPCRADIPHLKEVYELYHPHGFEVVSISMDADKDGWLKAVGEEQMKWLQLRESNAFAGELSKIYNFNGIPACILTGPDGVIVDRNMRGSWMDRELIKFYGNHFGDQY